MYVAGNIRELENVIERALVLDRDGGIGLDGVPPQLRAAEHQVGTLHMELPDEGVSFEDVEKELLLAALRKHNWNQTRAAAYLKITPSTLVDRRHTFELGAPPYDGADRR